MPIIFEEGPEFKSSEWADEMSENKHILKDTNVRHIFLVHGTFTGDNALGLFDIFEPIEKNLTGSTTIIDKLKSLGKSALNFIVDDVGNYTESYANSLSEGLNKEIPCDLFIWGSGNFHLARLKGAIKLVEKLADIITHQNIHDEERILLIGHSHAGQLFALLTTFLENGNKAQQLFDVIDESNQLGTKTELLSHLDKIKMVHFDIVTFGTPVRYSWGKYDNYRLLAIVNHRSPIDITGLLTTRDGDYVQQWGAEGTDINPTSEANLNDKLDVILDKGRDISLLRDSLKHKNRRHPHYADGTVVAETLLIDYKDNAAPILGLPISLDISHCVKTLFGHGVYTEAKAMLFNINKIVEFFY